MSVSKTNDPNQIKINMSNPIQEPPASSKDPNQDLKDMHVLCTFKIKIESQNLEHGFIKDQWLYQNQDQDANPSQEPQASTNQDLKDIDVLYTFKIILDSWNSEHWFIKEHWPWFWNIEEF